MIACVLLPDIVSSVENRTHPETVGVSIILTDIKGYIRAVTFDLARSGVRVGMKVRGVHALFPHAVIASFDERPYRELVDEMGDLFLDFTSRVELTLGFWNLRKKQATSPHPSGAVYYLDLGKLTKESALSNLQTD